MQQAKDDKELRRKYMTWAMDLKIQSEREREKGREEKRADFIKLLLKSGMQINEIAERTHFSLSSIQAIANKLI